jgi:hypothetical protein
MALIANRLETSFRVSEDAQRVSQSVLELGVERAETACSIIRSSLESSILEDRPLNPT